VTDRAHGASAGLRGHRNIEIMQQRRFKKWDHYGVFEPLNDLDEWGSGIQVPASYYMQFSNSKSSEPVKMKSKQREI